MKSFGHRDCDSEAMPTSVDGMSSRNVRATEIRHDLLRPIMWTAVVWNIAWFVLQAAYVPYAVNLLGLSAAGVGSTLATYGAGMVVGATLASRLMRSANGT